MMQIFRQSLLLTISFALIFAWQNTFFSQYTIQILGFLIFLYLISTAKRRGKPLDMLGNSTLSIFVLNTVIFLLIFSTGGFSSSLFFLLYFLVFGIAFIFEPATVFVFVLGSALIFFPQTIRDNVLENLIRIGSLVLISPLAFFFGREYVKGERQDEATFAIKERTKDAADTISSDVEGLLKDKKEVLKSKDVEKLNEILEETENLREEAKEKE